MERSISTNDYQYILNIIGNFEKYVRGYMETRNGNNDFPSIDMRFSFKDLVS